MKAGSAAVPALAAIAAGVAARRVWRADREVKEIEAEAHRHEAYIRELEAFSTGRELIVQRTENTAAAVELGTSVVKFSHHAIAAIPFTILEAIPVTRHTTLVVHKTHDVIADGVYLAAGKAARAVSVWVGQSLSAKNTPTLAPPTPLAIQAS